MVYIYIRADKSDSVEACIYPYLITQNQLFQWFPGAGRLPPSSVLMVPYMNIENPSISRGSWLMVTPAASMAVITRSMLFIITPPIWLVTHT